MVDAVVRKSAWTRERLGGASAGAPATTASIYVPADEGTDFVNRLSTFGQPPGKQMPNMPHALPDFQLNINPMLTSTRCQSRRITQQNLSVADMDEYWRQAM